MLETEPILNYFPSIFYWDKIATFWGDPLILRISGVFDLSSFLISAICLQQTISYPSLVCLISLLIYHISYIRWVRFSQINLAKLLLSIKICQRQGSRIKSKLMTSSYPTLFILEWWIFGIMRWIWWADESFLLPTFLGSCISLLCTQRGGCCPS